MAYETFGFFQKVIRRYPFLELKLGWAIKTTIKLKYYTILQLAKQWLFQKLGEIVPSLRKPIKSEKPKQTN